MCECVYQAEYHASEVFLLLFCKSGWKNIWSPGDWQPTTGGPGPRGRREGFQAPDKGGKCDRTKQPEQEEETNIDHMRQSHMHYKLFILLHHNIYEIKLLVTKN